MFMRDFLDRLEYVADKLLIALGVQIAVEYTLVSLLKRNGDFR